MTVILEKNYKALRPTPTRVESSKTLFVSTHTTLLVHGCFTGTIQQEEKATEQEIFVVIGAHQALLGPNPSPFKSKKELPQMEQT